MPDHTLRARYLAVRDRRWFRWSADGLMLLVVLTVLGAWQSRHSISGPAPAAILQTLSGTPVSLASFTGKPTLLAFWAPWCGVCKVESQNLSWVRKLVGASADVVSVAVSYPDVVAVRAYVQDRGVDYPVLLGDDALVQAFHVEGYPTVYFLDAEGRVKRSAVGYTTTLGLLLRLLL